ncbi:MULTISPECIES: TQO small subunit DoxD [unclassified Streptomyces]|uniref:TQO small subunit DoxD n=1 Tax=unclassified Streptomyces TaxID=2593676 RepID=UPI002DBC8261|nr:TQO small subunit DoxD [Streptomyces sp. H27-D2]MEC4017096.1 TQO small subunit DoxD [Streptomyces sp. H27-D2]
MSRLLLAVCRVAVGLLWIQNLSWKHPPAFGKDSGPPRDLYRWTLNGVEHEVFAPWAWLVEHVIIPNFAVFAWGAFAVEACLGAFLLVGLATRFWALVGLVQTTAITFSVLNTPHEWFWSYFLMYVAHLALLATAAGRAYGVDGALRPAWRQRHGLLSRLLLVAS